MLWVGKCWKARTGRWSMAWNLSRSRDQLSLWTRDRNGIFAVFETKRLTKHCTWMGNNYYFHSHKDWDQACHPGFLWLLLAYQKSQIVTIHSFLDLQKMIPKTFYRFSESAFGELLDQFGEMILLILIQIYKSGVTNWLSFQNTSFTGPGVMPSYKPTLCGQHVASSDGSKMISHKINTCEIFKTLCRTLIYYEITRVQNSEL